MYGYSMRCTCSKQTHTNSRRMSVLMCMCTAAAAHIPLGPAHTTGCHAIPIQIHFSVSWLVCHAQRSVPAAALPPLPSHSLLPSFFVGTPSLQPPLLCSHYFNCSGTPQVGAGDYVTTFTLGLKTPGKAELLSGVGVSIKSYSSFYRCDSFFVGCSGVTVFCLVVRYL